MNPFALTRRQMEASLPSPKLIQRMIYSSAHKTDVNRWLEVIRKGKPGCPLLVSFESFQAACERIRRGEIPPPLPSERKRKPQSRPDDGKHHNDVTT